MSSKKPLNNKIKDEAKIKSIKNNFKCSKLKSNYIDDGKFSFGYPILQKKIVDKENKIVLYPIPQLYSYNDFISNIGINNFNFYDDLSFNSGFYYYWIPIYIDKNHFSKNKKTIFNLFSLIKYGIDNKEYIFTEELIFEIFPIILNRINMRILDGLYLDDIIPDFIQCYTHLILLFNKLSTNEFEKQIKKYLNHKFNLIYNNCYDVTKSIIPNLDNFFVLLLFSNINTYNEKTKEIWNGLFEEFLIRQIYWIFFNGGKIEDILMKIQVKDEKDIIIKEYLKEMNIIKKETMKECIENDVCSLKIDDNKTFINLLKSEGIYNKIANAIKNLNNNVKYYKKIKLDDVDNFQKFYNNLGLYNKKRIINILLTNQKFDDYLSLSPNYKVCLNKALDELFNKYKKEIYLKEKYDIIDKLLYENTNIDKEIIDEFLEYAFITSKGSNILFLNYFFYKKIEEKKFMEKLENNCGTYLEINDCIKEIKLKLKEIKSYKQLFKYCGNEYGNNLSEIELIKNAYEKAKKKQYINNENKIEKMKGDYFDEKENENK